MNKMKEATDIFSEWATIGKDEGMEKGHSQAVTEMLDTAIPKLTKPFTAIDIGWVGCKETCIPWGKSCGRH